MKNLLSRIITINNKYEKKQFYIFYWELQLVSCSIIFIRIRESFFRPLLCFCFWIRLGMAYFLDRPDFALPKKLGLSFIGIILLVVLGIVFFNLEIAIPSIIRFSTVFVAYYLFNSFRQSKSLRN